MVRHGIVAATAIAAHASALRNGFVWLDHAHIEDKAAIASPGRWPHLFLEGFAGTGYYRPLTALSISVDALVGSPTFFHATNVLWHAIAAVLVGIAAEALGLSRRAAAIAALLFAVHPLTSLVASAIAFRSESILVASLMLLVWAHLNGRSRLAALAVLAAALAKETGLALAPLFVLVLRPPDRKIYAWEGGAIGAALVLRVFAAPSWRASHPALGLGDAVGTRLASLTKSVLRMTLPIDRTICDAFPITHWWQPMALAGLALFGLLAWLAFKRRGPALLMGLAILPALQLVPVMRWWSPHYVHLAFGFGAMLVAEVADRLGTNACRAVLAALCLFAGVTFHEDKRFVNDKALWSKEVALHPTCREGQFFLGEVARADKHFKNAGVRYEAALAERRDVIAYVDRSAALQNLGVIRLQQRAFTSARDAFQAALETNPAKPDEVAHNLALALFRMGDVNGAEQVLNRPPSDKTRPETRLLLQQIEAAKR